MEQTGIFKLVTDLKEFNIVNSNGDLVPMLGKDYFVLNGRKLENYILNIGTDRKQLMQWLEEKRLYTFNRWADIDIHNSIIQLNT